jgi:hypothetical protein
LFSISRILAIDLSYKLLLCWGTQPSIPSFFSTFIIKGCWILWEAFLHLLRRFCNFSHPQFIYCIGFTNLIILNHPCFPGMKLSWSWCDLFDVFLYSVCQYFVKNLWSMLFKDIGLQFSLFFFIFIRFWNECKIDFIKLFWQCSLSFCFLDKFEGYWYYFFLKIR